MKKLKIYLILFISLAIAPNVFSQSAKQKELEAKRQSILSEIKQINSLLFKTRGEKKSVLHQVEDLDQRISTRENLIRVTNQQANLLTREINDNLTQIDDLRGELKELKEDYAAMIRKSYKSKSQQSRVMFLMSSESFLQAYKRVQYMKQYAKHRKMQGESIKEKTTLLQSINTSLIAQKNQKKLLIEENRAAKARLNKEKKDQQALVASLKKDEGKFASQIRTKQKEANRIDREIDAMIKAVIAAANKASGTKTTTSTKSRKFALTPEAKALSSNFKNNKGKLLWPVEKGVVVKQFGKKRHPQFPNVTTNNNGVDITTEANAKARAVFKGEVVEIQQIKGANKVVYIRHGEYITIYRNLTSISVKKGEKVATKQDIGTIFKNPTTGKTTLKFYIFKNDEKMNPADWVYRM